MQEDLYEKYSDIDTRLAIVEKVTNDHSNHIQKLQEKNDLLIEMKTLMSLQMEVNSEQKEQMKDFGLVLVKVNDNLTELNNNQKQMKKDMSEIGNRVSYIEQYQESQKIDPVKLFKGILSYVATGIGSIAIAYIVYLLTKGN